MAVVKYVLAIDGAGNVTFQPPNEEVSLRPGDYMDFVAPAGKNVRVQVTGTKVVCFAKGRIELADPVLEGNNITVFFQDSGNPEDPPPIP